MKWKRLKSVFGKRRIKSILSVEYSINGTIIRSISKLELEEAIMKENSTRFKLAYSSSLFHLENIK